jgi:hypothetical protein
MGIVSRGWPEGKGHSAAGQGRSRSAGGRQASDDAQASCVAHRTVVNVHVGHPPQESGHSLRDRTRLGRLGGEEVATPRVASDVGALTALSEGVPTKVVVGQPLRTQRQGVRRKG